MAEVDDITGDRAALAGFLFAQATMLLEDAHGLAIEGQASATDEDALLGAADHLSAVAKHLACLTATITALLTPSAPPST